MEFRTRRDLEDGKTHCVRTVHAELNAILQAARFGPSTNGATIYTTMFPCRACAMALINAGIKRVVAKNDYQDSEASKELFKWAGVEWELRSEELLYRIS